MRPRAQKAKTRNMETSVSEKTPALSNGGSAGTKRGLHIESRFTEPRVNPFNELEWVRLS